MASDESVSMLAFETSERVTLGRRSLGVCGRDGRGTISTTSWSAASTASTTLSRWPQSAMSKPLKVAGVRG